jgi:hypothetical protein
MGSGWAGRTILVDRFEASSGTSASTTHLTSRSSVSSCLSARAQKYQSEPAISTAELLRDGERRGRTAHKRPRRGPIVLAQWPSSWFGYFFHLCVFRRGHTTAGPCHRLRSDHSECTLRRSWVAYGQSQCSRHPGRPYRSLGEKANIFLTERFR